MCSAVYPNNEFQFTTLNITRTENITLCCFELIYGSQNIVQKVQSCLKTRLGKLSVQSNFKIK